MEEQQWLAEQFEENRRHLGAVAYRMLGSASEAEDAVQEAWLRLSRTDIQEVRNLSGWLTTVVARVCLDMLRSRKSRREEPLDEQLPNTLQDERPIDPEQEALMADSVGLALLVVLERLAPAERLAFVLHDLFAVPFEEIAPIVGRSSESARQLASRARRRVRGTPPELQADLVRQRSVVEAFISAARGGDLKALLAVLDPEVVYRADSTLVPPHGSEVRGATNVAQGAMAFSRRAGIPQPTLALVNGAVGVVIAPGGRLLRAVAFRIREERIVEIDVISDPDRLAQLDLALLDG